MLDEENIFLYFLGCKGLSNDDIKVARATVLSGDMAGNWFQNRRFSLKKRVLGGLP